MHEFFDRRTNEWTTIRGSLRNGIDKSQSSTVRAAPTDETTAGTPSRAIGSFTCASQGVESRDEAVREPIDAIEVFEYVKDIKDPEHPYSLEQLNVLREEHITVDDAKGLIK